MKKHVLLLLSVLSLTFVSCEGPIGPPGEGLVPYVEYIKIQSNQWENYATNDYVSFYKCVRDVDVRDNAYKNGFVNVYLFQMDDGNEIQTPLPYWIQHTDRGNTWLEGYNFDFDRKTIAFYADCKRGERPPLVEFRVVVAP
jgi:hypothetical protein